MKCLRLPAALALVFSTGTYGASDKLVIGMDATYPPFEMLDSKGECSGVGADLGRALAAYLGREAEFRNINFDGLITALKSSSIDCVISSMTANDERRKSISFSDPYVKNGLAMLISAKSPVNSLEELNRPGRRLAVRLGTTGESFARQFLKGSVDTSRSSSIDGHWLYPSVLCAIAISIGLVVGRKGRLRKAGVAGILLGSALMILTFIRSGHTGQSVDIIALDSDSACVLEVVNGNVDAWIYDQISIMLYHDRHPEATRALLKPLREEFWAIGLRQGDDALRGTVNEFIKKYRAEGGFTKLAEKHLMKEKKMMAEQGIPFVFDL